MIIIINPNRQTNMCKRAVKTQLGRISKLAVQYVCMSEIRNVSDFSSHCYGYHILDIVLYRYPKCFSLYDDYVDTFASISQNT